MQDTWRRLDAWFAANAPAVTTDLSPGAPAKSIAALEKAVGAELPDDFKQAYAIHDGQKGVGPAAFGDWHLLPIKAIQKQWKLMKGLLDRGVLAVPGTAVGPVQPVWWDAKWIPVGGAGNGDYQCIDLNPAKGGKVGQIITFLHRDERRERVAKSLREWMDTYAADYEKGLYKLKDDMLVRARKRKA